MTEKKYKRSASLQEFFEYFDKKVRRGESDRLDGCEVIVLEMYDAFLQKQNKVEVDNA